MVMSTSNSANITFSSILAVNTGVYTCLATTPYTRAMITANITVISELMCS